MGGKGRRARAPFWNLLAGMIDLHGCAGAPERERRFALGGSGLPRRFGVAAAMCRGGAGGSQVRAGTKPAGCSCPGGVAFAFESGGQIVLRTHLFNASVPASLGVESNDPNGA
jgi:hypothetical protein